MATRIEEGMTGAEVAQIIDNGFDNLEELNQRVEINETALEDIKNMSFVSELMGIGTTKEEVNINYRGMSQGIGFEFQRTIPSASTLNAGVMTAADKTKLDLVVTDGDGMQFLSDDGTYKTIADEEDITAKDGNLRLKDRAYDADNFSGKGYKILRKNIQQVTVPKFDLTVNTGCTVNGNITINEISIEVTTEASTPEAVAQLIQSAISGTTISGAVVTFTSNPTIDYSTTGVSGQVVDNSYQENRNILTQNMINEPDTVYEIRYDFNLNGATITIPESCTLKFEGGSLNNGTIVGNNTYVLLYSNCINVSSNGNFKNINNIVFSNVEELVSANNLLSGFKVSVLGYYEKEDGGDAQYIIKIKEESDIVDKGSIIELNNNLYAKIIPINGKVNLRQFGAKPCNYWSEYFDSTVFIQNAFNYVSKYSNSTYSNDLICKTIEVNGVFYTKELNIFGVNNNTRIEIKGVGNSLSGFEYIGDNGYKIDKTSSNNNSYILKITNCNNSFIIRNISFKGLLNRSNNVQSVAAYGLYFDGSYDYGSIIENCSFSTFVKSGLYFKGGLNTYIKGARFDICINSCIEADRLMNFVLKDFTIDIVYHNFTFLNEDIKEFFYQFPHIGDSNIALGNSILYIHTGTSNSVINIEQARIEGGKFPYEENNPSSFIKIDKTNQYNFNYAGSFNLSNINFTVIPDYIVYCVDKSYSPIINFNNFNTVNRIAVINIDKYNLKSSIAPKNGIVFNDKIHNVDGSSLFINGKNIIISPDKYCPYFVKCKDIVLLEKYDNTFDDAYKNFIGAVCTYPINGYGYAMKDSWYPNDFEIAIDENKNIISKKQLYFNYNYTITYDDEFKEEIVVSDVIYDNNKYIGICNKYIPTRNSVFAKINYTKAKFRFFGNTTNDYLSGNTNQRNLISTEKSIGDFYFDTTLNKPVWWNGTEWIDYNGNPADVKTSGSTTNRPTGVQVGFQYFDTDINSPVYWSGTEWVQPATGNTGLNVVKITQTEYDALETKDKNTLSAIVSDSTNQ